MSDFLFKFNAFPFVLTIAVNPTGFGFPVGSLNLIKIGHLRNRGQSFVFFTPFTLQRMIASSLARFLTSNIT